VIFNIQLVFDCTDPDEIMWFWGPKLDYRQEHVPPDERKIWRKDFPQFDGRGRIDDGDGRRMPIYIQNVPEPKQGPNRLRLEISSPDEAPGEHADVEGNEYVVTRGEISALRTIVFDCVDRDRMLEFWTQATGYIESDGRLEHQHGAFRIENGALVCYGEKIPDHIASFVIGFTEPSNFPDGPVHDLIPGIAFRETGEPKRFKNRLHLDLRSLHREAERERLENLGATVRQWDTNHVMADPEGNEFCVG
jgi:hypothetical protein